MGLVKCPDCGKEVSDRADACPNCGCPGKYFPGRMLQIGDSYMFGNWGGEDIEWRVLDVEDGRALLITERAIDSRQYNEEYCDVTWKECALRAWLNGEFLGGAFSGSERGRISETSAANRGNAEYGTKGGPDTEDHVFCLSIDEAGSYFANDDARICFPTRCAEGNGIWVDDNSACRWWLRSPGNFQDCAAYVNVIGHVNGSGCVVRSVSNGVRPALWLDL